MSHHEPAASLGEYDNNDWILINQQCLQRELDLLCHRLENYINKHSGDSESFENVAKDVEIPDGFTSAIDSVQAIFSLSDFERDVLLLCAGIELDHRVAMLCAKAIGADGVNANFSLAMALFTSSHWSALLPVSPLRKWQLVNLISSSSLSFSSLSIDERILHFLAGLSYLDERVGNICKPVTDDVPLALSHHQLFAEILTIWNLQDKGFDIPVIHLYGDEVSAMFSIAASVCKHKGLRSFVIDAHDIAASQIHKRKLSTLWDREAMLSPAALIVSVADATDKNAVIGALDFIDSATAPMILLSQEPLGEMQRDAVRFEVMRTKGSDQYQLWESQLGHLAEKLNGQLSYISSQFNLNSSEVRNVCSQVIAASSAMPDGTDADSTAKKIWDACLIQTRHQLDDLAERIEPKSTWDDIVLPQAQKQLLHNIALHVRNRNTVYQHWGFADKSSRGLGISALFSGVSGTGKTMAAEVIAKELNLDLYRIDLSSVVSKYIGETEKNLKRIFDAAESGSSILLFDEADALFGKRSDVKDSHDRYANIEVSYLLQRMESFSGLAILTTNMKTSLDQAFLRRIRFIVQFPFPGKEQRADIWAGIYPLETPRSNLNLEQLSRLNIAGGNIRNIALNAAFLAAESDDKVNMYYLLQATKNEFTKLEKSLTDSEISGWV